MNEQTSNFNEISLAFGFFFSLYISSIPYLFQMFEVYNHDILGSIDITVENSMACVVPINCSHNTFTILSAVIKFIDKNCQMTCFDLQTEPKYLKKQHAYFSLFWLLAFLITFVL
jgi:hypothetical protein